MKLKSPKGGSALEFAIVLPILLLLVLGIFEFGILLYNQAVITNACREGARAGIIRDGPYGNPVPVTEVERVVNDYCSTLITLRSPTTPPTVATAGCPTGSYSGSDLTVTVTFQHNYLALPTFVGSLVGGTELTAVSVMRCE